MKLLFVLRGLPGSGKSTFIKEHDLEPFTIEPDNIRMLFGGIERNINGNFCISQSYDTKVWSLVDELLCNRLEKGITTFLDATSISMKSLNHYKDLCDRYETKLYVVDFTDVPLDVVKSRNNLRDEYKKVPEEVIDRMNNQLQNKTSMRGFTVISPNDVEDVMMDSIKSLKVNANNYEKVIVFGDIHGCHSVLYKVMSEYKFSDKNLYVFCGDYFDRGIENREMLEFCLTFCKKDNFIFLKGNHELHIRNYLRDGVIDTPAFGKSLEQMGELKGQLKDFYNTLKPFVTITKGHTTINVSHGGIPTLPNSLYSEYEYVKGVGKYQSSEDVDNAFTNGCHFNEYSVHGHRNIYDVPVYNTEKTYNLEGQIELGGNLRYLEIDDEGIKDKMLHNEIFDESLANKHQKKSIVDSLNDSELIRKKELANGVVSYNFTRDAFFKSAWNNLTTTARGLFVDSETENVIARSYPKFFTLDERPETKLSNLKDNLVFPVEAYLKENGFLGIVSYDPKTNDLFIASKSTNEGDYAENFKRILLSQLGDKKDVLMKVLKDENCSAIFECIDPINDPHIIEYDKEEVVLLDVVQNDFTDTFKSYVFTKMLALNIGVKCKELSHTFNTFEEFEKFMTDFDLHKSLLKQDNPIEGFVFVDSKGFRFKYKTMFYKFWKNMRKLKDVIIQGKEPKPMELMLEKMVYGFMKTIPVEDLQKMSVIQIRNEYLTKHPVE